MNLLLHVIAYYHEVIMNSLLHVVAYYRKVIMISLLHIITCCYKVIISNNKLKWLHVTYVACVHGPLLADTPNMKNPADVARSAEIFSIVAQYFFSDNDSEYFDKVPEHICNLWYLSFANSQNAIVHSKLLHNTKEYFSWYPEKGSSPHIKYGKKIGLNRQWPEVSDFVARFCTLSNTLPCENPTRFQLFLRESHAFRV